MSVVDDFGRFDGRPSVLRGRLYALQLELVREANIVRWLAECEAVNLVRLYTHAGKPYITFLKLGPARAQASKYPAPPWETEPPGSTQPFTDVNGHTRTDTGAPYSGSYSSADSDSRSEEDSSEVAKPPSEPAEMLSPTVMIFPIVGKGSKEWPLTEAKLAEWRETYPDLDVLAEARKARQWVLDDPKRRKTAGGMPKFLGGWFARTQNRGPPSTANGHPPEPHRIRHAADNPHLHAPNAEPLPLRKPERQPPDDRTA
jgi:hypothetical protein